MMASSRNWMPIKSRVAHPEKLPTKTVGNPVDKPCTTTQVLEAKGKPLVEQNQRRFSHIQGSGAGYSHIHVM
jgi:hypothetical protein